MLLIEKMININIFDIIIQHIMIIGLISSLYIDWHAHNYEFRTDHVIPLVDIFLYSCGE